jgi:hypothetical protein
LGEGLPDSWKLQQHCWCYFLLHSGMDLPYLSSHLYSCSWESKNIFIVVCLLGYASLSTNF